MKITHFKLTEKVLLDNGYKLSDVYDGFLNQHWKRPCRKKGEYPRFHIIIEEDKTWSIHCDYSKIHGALMKLWGRSKRSNVIYCSSVISREIVKLKMDTYLEVLDTMKEKILEIRKGLKKINDFR